MGCIPQSQAGALANAFRTSDWRDRDNPILLAATRIRENVSRMTRDAMKTTIQAAFGDSLTCYPILATLRRSCC
jgi:hypothetical protein